MKELSIEQKAKRYDEALERAKDFMNGEVHYALKIGENIMCWIFPELKEAEDERIRKALVEMVHDTTGDSLWIDYNVHKENALAWLEKQGSQILANSAKTCKDEQRPADKVEPKFKVGDFIVNNNSRGVCQVTEIRDDEYCLYPLYGEIMGYLRIIDVDNEYHLWTIQDAKNGDVLARNNDILSICIFSHFDGINNKYSSFLCHCGLEGEGLGQVLSINGYYDDCKDYVPATKEQRDLLFQKMKEAGYEWNAEKKELKKIEDEPKNYKQQVMTEITDLVKDYIQQKSALSKEDENILTAIIYTVRNSGYKHCMGVSDKTMLDWLKSLKDRYTWKPSEEQMSALDSMLQYGRVSHNSFSHLHLNSLFNDLKKLREE